MTRILLNGADSERNIRRPTQGEITQWSAAADIHLDPAEFEELRHLIDGLLSQLDSLREISVGEPGGTLDAQRHSRRPSAEEDPFNAFIVKCNVRGTFHGRLHGKTVGLKDNICLAGVPMTNGSLLVPDYVPDIDATVVERLLAEGAVITGKLNMDDFGFGGTGESSAFGQTRNPGSPEHSPGGSSSGCGAAVAAGAVDIALAVDQGGSARVPAAWCGVVGLKPTHGLVPTYGVTAMEYTLDTVCPMARDVETAALALEAIAGDDPRDVRWAHGHIRSEEYRKASRRDMKGLRVGIVVDALDQDVVQDDVRTVFQRAMEHFESRGAVVRRVEVPLWRYARAIWNGIALHSATLLVESDLEGYGREGMCNAGWHEAFARARRDKGHLLPPVLKAMMAIGGYLRREHRGRYFCTALALRHALRRQLNEALQKSDVLATPTTPMTASRLLNRRPNSIETACSFSNAYNTCPLSVSGHPALSVPCGFGADGLPVGLQLIGRAFEEGTLFGVAHMLETGDAKRRTGVHV